MIPISLSGDYIISAAVALHLKHANSENKWPNQRHWSHWQLLGSIFFMKQMLLIWVQKLWIKVWLFNFKVKIKLHRLTMVYRATKTNIFSKSCPLRLWLTLKGTKPPAKSKHFCTRAYLKSEFFDGYVENHSRLETLFIFQLKLLWNASEVHKCNSYYRKSSQLQTKYSCLYISAKSVRSNLYTVFCESTSTYSLTWLLANW